MRVLALSGGKDSMACLFLQKEQLEFAIYVDTGYSYPETHEVIALARTHVPVHVVRSNRFQQNYDHGIPADVVPIDWTTLGQQMTRRKPVKIQSYLGCCYENINLPLLNYAHAQGVTELVFGQRWRESHKSPSVDGDVVWGMKRIHPIEDWTDEHVLEYLATQMKVPAHFYIKHSSLDCYDCTAFKRESRDRVEWMRMQHPRMFLEYLDRKRKLDAALDEAL